MIISGPFVFAGPTGRPRFEGTPGDLGAISWTGPYAPRYPGGPGGPGLPGVTGATASTGFPS